MKILAARSNQEKSAKEITILGELRGGDQSSRGNAYIVTLLDEFYIEGPNGRHRCLVMELLGPSLDSVINDCNFVPLGQPATSEHRLDSDVILRVSKQLLSTLVTLHERGIAHGGKTLSPSTRAVFILFVSKGRSLTCPPRFRYQRSQYRFHRQEPTHCFGA